jgi:hypothetical protein
MAESEFVDLIGQRLKNLLGTGLYLLEHGNNGALLTRPLLGQVLSESGQLEELLDAYGARNNSRWFMFREIVAAAKVFARMAYILLHIHHSQPRYQLLPVEGDFNAETEAAITYLRQLLTQIMRQLWQQVKRLELYRGNNIRAEQDYRESLPEGLLPRDRKARHAKHTKEAVVHVATEYLQAATSVKFLRTVSQSKPKEYARLIPDPVSEESLRTVEHEFHSLQSLYDTYLADTETEADDEKLPVLRGHITVCFHLFEAATQLTHFYERHLLTSSRTFNLEAECGIKRERLLQILMQYCLLYAARYLENGRMLCHDILRRYEEITRITVAVPDYRGFHVRPATLIANIVRHYGSEVKMWLNSQSYDAGSPLELFRANEEINAIKRRRLAERIDALPLPDAHRNRTEFRRAVRSAVLSLAEKNEIIIYQHPLPLDKIKPGRDQTLEEFVVEQVKRLLAMGKIDIESEAKVKFEGDRRTLADIKLLAESGYGEDRFGNNIPLPARLSYLR